MHVLSILVVISALKGLWSNHARRNERKIPAVVGAETSNVERWGAHAERSNEGSDFGATLLSAEEAG